MSQHTAPAPFPAPTLEQLAGLVGEPDEQLRNALFRRTAEASLVEHGTRVDTQYILEDIPPFVAASLDTMKRLHPAQRALLKLPPGIFALLVDESRVLQRLKADHDAMLAAVAGGTRSEREAALRQSMREGLALRNVTRNALRNVLGREGLAEVDQSIGVGDTPAKLAAGLDALAALLRRKLQGDPVERYLFSEFGLDEACANEVSACAARIRKLDEAPPAPDRIVTQRMLDLQDGRVLHLIAMVLRAFRAAHKADATIPEPELHTIGWLFDGRSTRRPG
ncbi:MAG: hypothetical protein RMJ98_10855 [Myxococcales bacterium]|nr:hypothetical protein [Polyangiaceae bacterium]MDW8249785.1 hypothetical protein [Myxococcales bacterium]